MKVSENLDTIDINITSLINKTAIFIIYKFKNISIQKDKKRQVIEDLLYNNQFMI